MTDGQGSPTVEGDTPEPAEQSRRVTVMLLGSGDSVRELTTALQHLGAEVVRVEKRADVPAHSAVDHSLIVDTGDAVELTAVIERVRPHFVVTLTNGVAADALTAVEEKGLARIVPSSRSVRLSVDLEAMRRLAADELGLPTAPFWFAGSVDELKAVAAHAGFPLLVRPVVAEVGDGRSRVSRPDELETAWHRATSAGGSPTGSRVLAETAVEVDVHVTLLTVRTELPSGPVIEFCAPIGHSEVGTDPLESWQPQQLSPAALDAGKSIAARMVSALGGRGVFAVELMIRGDEVYFCDATYCPYVSGLVTLRTQRLSHYELQARAILGLTVDTIMVSPGAAQLIPAGNDLAPTAGHPDHRMLADALAVPESDIRVFSDHEAGIRRSVGAALATAPDVSTARDRARQVAAAVRQPQQPRPGYRDR